MSNEIGFEEISNLSDNFLNDKFYILDGKKVIPLKVGEILRNKDWLENYDNRIIAIDYINDYKVSTIFLAYDMGFKNEKLLFETMIFSPEGDVIENYQKRYSTYEQAEEGHQEAIKWLKDYLDNNT
jgi:hypothetical protein